MSDSLDESSIDPLPSPPIEPIVRDIDADAQQLADLRERVYSTLLKRVTIEPQLAWGLLLGGAFILMAVSAVLAFVPRPRMLDSDRLPSQTSVARRSVNCWRRRKLGHWNDAK